MKIFVQFHTGRILKFEFAPIDSIADVKSKIQDREGICPQDQHLVWNG